MSGVVEVLVKDASGYLLVLRGVDAGDGTAVLDIPVIAGERNASNETNSYLVTRPEASATRADTGTTELLITEAPAHLLGIIPNDANTGYVAVRDASAISGASTPIMLPNLGDAGIGLTGMAIRCENGITVQGENAACDVTVLWRPI